MKTHLRTHLIMLASALLLTALDQGVKHWARLVLAPVGRMPIIEGFIGFQFTTNAGAAFGILQGARWFFVALTVAVLACIVVFALKMPHTRPNLWVRVAITLIAAGALGNFIDRLMTGYVVDMFAFLFINFPVFNVADILLVTGTGIYIFAAIFILKDPPKAAKDDVRN